MPDANTSLRVGGGFAVLLAGSVGVLLPFLVAGAHDARAAPWLLLLKAFGAGVVLALALVHLINEAFEAFGELPPGSLYNDFPICGVFVSLGIYIMFLTERLSLDAFTAAEEEDCEHGITAGIAEPAPHQHAAGHGHAHAHAREAVVPAGSVQHAGAEPHSHEHLSALSAARSIISSHAGHAHRLLTAVSLSGAVEDKTPGARRRVMTARLLELSIVVHSFIIGLNLGTSVNGGHGHGEEEHATSTSEEQHAADAPDLRPVVALIIVLCFHQFFEGVALGSYIAELRAAASTRTKLAMSALFALTVPSGAWVGVGVASSYDAGSVTALWVTGTLNAVTGGMLLYSALITFMAEEFSRDDVGGGAAAGRALKRRMYAAMLLGAACMALLGLWA